MKAKLIPQIHHERLALQEHIPLATPLVIYLEPSGYCNLKCVFCPHSCGGKVLKKDFMPVKLFEKTIDDLSAFPETIKLLRVCGTGETLMNKNIAEMLKYAKEQKTIERIELVTNGTLLNADLIKDLPHFADRIVCSIEGLCSEDYQRTCNTSINFQSLLDNLKALHACKGECVIHIKIHNEAVLSEDRKATFLNMFSGYCDEIYIEKLVPMWPQLDIGRAPDEFRWGGKLSKHRICAQIFKGVQVQADGEVVPCCVDWKRVNVLGNVNKESLYEIWNSKKLRELQIEHLIGNKSKTEPCKDCTMNDYCEIDNIDLYAQECIGRLRRLNC